MDSTSTLIATAVVESERDDAYAQSIRTGKHHFTSDEPAALEAPMPALRRINC